ncbi:MAG TPA: hypothetical protein VF821_23705 [Lentzea sp.]
MSSLQIATHSSSSRRNFSSPLSARTASATTQLRGHHFGGVIPARRTQWATSRRAGARSVPITLVANGKSFLRPSAVDWSLTHRATHASTGCTQAGRSDHTSPASTDVSSIRQHPSAGVRCQPVASLGTRLTSAAFPAATAAP